MLKEDILKILAKDSSGGEVRPAYQSAKEPKTLILFLLTPWRKNQRLRQTLKNPLLNRRNLLNRQREEQKNRLKNVLLLRKRNLLKLFPLKTPRLKL